MAYASTVRQRPREAPMEQRTSATLSTGSDAKTHGKDEAMPGHPVASAATEPPPVTPLQDATNISFLHSPVGRTTDGHPAPRQQCVMVLTGSMEVEAGDGEKRAFTPGSVLLVTDGDGRGHTTRVVGDQAVLLVWVPLPKRTARPHPAGGKARQTRRKRQPLLSSLRSQHGTCAGQLPRVGR